LNFFAAVMDLNGNVPMIGDADDGVLVRFDPDRSACRYRSLLATGAAEFSRADFKRKARQFDEKSLWLLGSKGRSAFNELPAAAIESPTQSFPTGGYYILGTDFGLPSEIRAVADAGPLGYLSIAAHGHADALSFTLSVAGQEILIDSGTFAYHTEARWRSYFRGTSAHNTARIDQLDQSVAAGNFLWLNKAETKVLQWTSNPSEDRLVASHNGYLRLNDPVLHTRDLRLLKEQRLLLIEDRFEAEGDHVVELHWHFREDSAIRMHEGGFVAHVGPVLIESLFTGSAGSAELVRGCADPPLGWVSRRFDHREPTPVVRWSAPMHGQLALTTEMRISVGIPA